MIALILFGFAAVPLALCAFGMLACVLALPFYLAGRFLKLFGVK